MSTSFFETMKMRAQMNMFKSPSTYYYIFFIVLVNAAFIYMPSYTLFGQDFSSGDFLVGLIYVLRDFSQREIGHRVLIAMGIAAILSYFLSNEAVAVASLTAFTVGELIDWLIYTFTKRPLSERILLSSLISTPFDSVIFLAMLNMLNFAGVFVLTVSKMIGAFALWAYWKLYLEPHKKTIPPEYYE